MKTIITLAAVLSLSACALAPTYTSVELQHDSHTLQHFGADPTNYGFQEADVNAHWQMSPRWYADISEGVAFGGCSRAFAAGHETFSGRIGYVFWEKSR